MKARSVHHGRVQFSVRLPPQLYQQLVRHAEKEDRTMTNVVELAVKEYLKNATKP